jgi:hypothetical protein
MGRNRKSLWWWMTLRRYQMVMLQYREMIRLWKRSTTDLCEPHDLQGSLNLATYDEGETTRVLLSETARRVSTDAFQLARIAHNGCNFARMSLMDRIGNMGRLTDPRWEQVKMDWRRCMYDLHQRLIVVYQPFKANPSSSEVKLSQFVEDYVKYVIRQLENFLALTAARSFHFQ